MATAKNIRPRKKLNRVRQFNKRIFNHFIMTFAGHFLYSVVHHFGRRSGSAYQTPVVAVRYTGGFLIPLPYGSDTDWCLNVLAAGHCTIRWNSTPYRAVEPVVLDAAQALPLYPPLWRFIFRAFKIESYLKLKYPA